MAAAERARSTSSAGPARRVTRRPQALDPAVVQRVPIDRHVEGDGRRRRRRRRGRAAVAAELGGAVQAAVGEGEPGPSAARIHHSRPAGESPEKSEECDRGQAPRTPRSPNGRRPRRRARRRGRATSVIRRLLAVPVGCIHSQPDSDQQVDDRPERRGRVAPVAGEAGTARAISVATARRAPKTIDDGRRLASASPSAMPKKTAWMATVTRKKISTFQAADSRGRGSGYAASIASNASPRRSRRRRATPSPRRRTSAMRACVAPRPLSRQRCLHAPLRADQKRQNGEARDGDRERERRAVQHLARSRSSAEVRRRGRRARSRAAAATGTRRRSTTPAQTRSADLPERANPMPPPRRLRRASPPKSEQQSQGHVDRLEVRLASQPHRRGTPAADEEHAAAERVGADGAGRRCAPNGGSGESPPRRPATRRRWTAPGRGRCASRSGTRPGGTGSTRAGGAAASAGRATGTASRRRRGPSPGAGRPAGARSRRRDGATAWPPRRTAASGGRRRGGRSRRPAPRSDASAAGPEPLVVLLEEEAHAGRREQDHAEVEQRPQLPVDRDELPAGGSRSSVDACASGSVPFARRASIAATTSGFN